MNSLPKPLLAGTIIILLAVTLISGIAVVYSKNESRRLSITLENLQIAANELELEWQQLQLEQSTLTADAAVDQVARNHLQMIVPRLDEIKYIPGLSPVQATAGAASEQDIRAPQDTQSSSALAVNVKKQEQKQNND